MTKFTIANRKFLEEQVRSVLKEEINTFTADINPNSLSARSEIGLSDLKRFFKDIAAGFVNVGNDLKTRLFFSNNDFDRALSEFTLEDQAGGDKNREDLQKIKDYLSIFDVMTPKKGRWIGEGGKGIGDVISPSAKSYGKLFRRYLEVSKKIEKRRELSILNEKAYERAYDMYGKGSMLSGVVPIRFRKMLVNKQILKQNNVFENLAKKKIPISKSYLIFLRPFYEMLEDFDPNFEWVSASSIEKIISSYQTTFTGEYSAEEQDSYYRILYIAFAVASIVDPNGGQTMSQWFHFIRTALRKRGYEAGLSSIIPEIVVVFGAYSALYGALNAAADKISGSKSPGKFNLAITALVLFYDLIGTNFLKKNEIKTALNETLSVIKNIEKKKPTDGKWSFTDSENRQWREKYSTISELLTRAVSKSMRTTGMFESMDTKMQALNKEILKIFRFVSEAQKENINSANIQQIKSTIKNAEQTIGDYYTNLEEVKQKISLKEESRDDSQVKFGNLLLRSFGKYTKNSKYKDFYQNDTVWKKNVKLVMDMIQAYDMKSEADVDVLRRNLKQVGKEWFPKVKDTELLESKSKLKSNFSKFVTDNIGTFGLTPEQSLKFKQQGLYTTAFIHGGIIPDPISRAEGIQAFYYHGLGKGKASIFSYGQALSDFIMFDGVQNPKLKGGEQPISTVRNLFPVFMSRPHYAELINPKDEKIPFLGYYGIQETFRSFLKPKEYKLMSSDNEENSFINLVKKIVEVHVMYLTIAASVTKLIEKDSELTNEFLKPQVASYKEIEFISRHGSIAEFISVKKLNILKKIEFIDKLLKKNGFDAVRVFGNVESK